MKTQGLQVDDIEINETLSIDEPLLNTSANTSSTLRTDVYIFPFYMSLIIFCHNY